MQRLLRQKPYNPRSVAILALGLAAVGLFVAAVFAASPSKVQEVSVVEAGVVANPAAPYLLRDGGATGIVGGRLLWTFGDTIFLRQSQSGENGYSSTGALAELSTPSVVSEPLDSKGAPVSPLLPLTAAESAYNKASGDPNERYALWPAAVIPESPSSSLILYNRLKVHPGGLNYEHLGTGMARVSSGSTAAQRLTDELFVGKEDQYLHGYTEYGGYLYLYNCKNRAGTFDSDCSVARAPEGSVLVRSSYRYWNGNSWSTDIAKAVKTIPGSTSGFSVAYNPYLGVFVSTTSIGFSKSIIIRTAPAPEGPWSDSIVAYTASGSIYATTQHPELMTENGRNIMVSYYLPQDNWRGKLQLLSMRLNPRDSSSTPVGTNPGSTGTTSSGTGVSTSSTPAQPVAKYSAGSGSTSAASLETSETLIPAGGGQGQQVNSEKKGFWGQVWWVLTTPWRWLAGLF